MSAIAVLRNRVTTEFKKVERGGDEYLELQAQRDPNDGKPVWEETGLHDAVEQSKRLAEGRALPTDVGDAAQPVIKLAGSVNVVPASAVLEPLPSEREAGVEPEEGPRFGYSQEPDEEVPLVVGMEDATDTDTSGTDEEVAQEIKDARQGGKSGASGSKMSKRRSSKKADESSSES